MENQRDQATRGYVTPPIDFDRTGRFGGLPIHDTVEREWRHADFFQYKCHLHAKAPSVDTADGNGNCGGAVGAARERVHSPVRVSSDLADAPDANDDGGEAAEGSRHSALAVASCSR